MDNLTHEQWLASMNTAIQTLQAISTQMNGLTSTATTEIDAIEAKCAALRQIVEQAPQIKNAIDQLASGTIGLRDILQAQ